MGKLPAFQFYPGDWMQDTRALSLAAKGAWIDLLCAMWRSQTRGTITLPLVGYARLIGATADQAKAAIDELTDMCICDCVTSSNGDVTVTNRRMVREEKERETTRYRVQRFRNAETKRDCNAAVTVPSSSSSSSSVQNTSGKKVFIKPSVEDVSSYCRERKNTVDPRLWIDHYTSNGWMVGKNKMSDWKAAVRTWEKSPYGAGSGNGQQKKRMLRPSDVPDADTEAAQILARAGEGGKT